MPAPTYDDFFNSDYMDDDGNFSESGPELNAFLAEKAAQRSVCKVPAEDADWPADLVEALYRRVAHNLAVRGNALGLQRQDTAFGSTAMRIGGTDAEVRRLEGPYRKRVVG